LIFSLILTLSGTLYSVNFKYYTPYADSVFLAGTFNGWNAHSIRMQIGIKINPHYYQK